MRISVKKSILFVIVALIVLLVVGSAVAAPLSQHGINGEPEPEAEGNGDGEAELEIIGPDNEGASLHDSGPDEANPSGTALRINFKVGGHVAIRGLYVVQEVGGDALASWYAIDGWTDSGWFEDIDLGTETVLVQVLYYPGPDTKPTVMKILNPAPKSKYGWVSQGISHAIEVAWPEGTEMYTSMEAAAGK